MKNKIRGILLSLCLFAILFPATASAAEGEDGVWSTWGGIDWMLTEDGTLTIRPTDNAITKTKPWSGELYERGEWPAAVNDSISNVEGWPYDRATVKRLVIEEGVTYIGSFTVWSYENLTGEVVLPSTLAYIGQEAFEASPITKFTFAKGGTETLCVSVQSFAKTNITDFEFPNDRPVHVHAWLFKNCTQLENVYFPDTAIFSGHNHVDYRNMSGDGGNHSYLFNGCAALENVAFANMDICDSFRSTGRVYDGMPTATANKIKNNPTIVSKITFDYGIANISSESFFVIDGDFLTPDKPSFAGYIFMGWYADSAYQTPFDFTTPITDDITIYAEFADYTGDISGINDQINTLAQNLNSAKAELQTKIDTKADAAAVNAALTDLQSAIDALNAVKDDYVTADDALKADLEEKINAAKSAAVSAAEELVSSAKAELQTKIDTKANAADVNTAIAKLQNAIAALEKAKDNYIAADTVLKAELEASIAKAKQEYNVEQHICEEVISHLANWILGKER